jgi:hypothetical protein
MDFDLCVECFSVGVELGDHKNTHAYRVMDYLAFPLFELHWGADEEILFLEAIDMYGIGNWQAIAEHVGEKDALVCLLSFLTCLTTIVHHFLNFIPVMHINPCPSDESSVTWFTSPAPDSSAALLA